MTNYIALIEKHEEGDFGVSFPDFPGCITSGATLDEAQKNAEEALELHVAGMQEDKDDIPAPSDLDDLDALGALDGFVPFLVRLRRKESPVRLSITMDPNLVRDIDAEANRLGYTRSGYLAMSARQTLHHAR